MDLTSYQTLLLLCIELLFLTIAALSEYQQQQKSLKPTGLRDMSSWSASHTRLVRLVLCRLESIVFFRVNGLQYRLETHV